MKNFLNFLVTICILFFITSCENNALEEEIPEGFVCTTDVSYTNDINPLFTQKCSPCHIGGGQFPDLTTYESVSQNADAIKAQTQSGNMPKEGMLTQDQIDLIACWVDNGAFDN